MSIKGVETLVTPAQAEKWLEKSAPNRPVSDATVRQYATDMRKGNWRLTGQAVIFDWNGNLIDGQHRLWAVVESQQSVSMFVVHGVDPEAFMSIDRNRPRTLATILTLMGVTSASRAVAVVRQMEVAKRGEDYGKYSVDEALAALERHPGCAWILTRAGATKGSAWTTAPVLAAFGIAYEHSPRITEKAWECWLTGAGLDVGDPLLTMRNMLAERADEFTSREGRRSVVRRMLAALAYRQKGRKLTKSQDSTEGLKFFLGSRAARTAANSAAAVTAAETRTEA